MKNWVHAFILLLVYKAWSYWLSKTEIIAANSTAELISWGFKRLFKKGNVMSLSASQNIGSVGQVTESYAAGVASASGVASLPVTSFGLSLSLQATASLDAKILTAFLAAKIGGPIPAEVASFIEMALSAS